MPEDKKNEFKPEERPKDSDLLERMAKGDQQALETLMRYWSRPVFSLAIRILGNESSAEEVTQDVFLKIWKNAKLFSLKKGAFSSWILTMTHHAAIDLYRRLKSRGSKVTRGLDDTLIAVLPLPKKGITPPQQMALQAALEALPAAQRKVVELAYFEGYTRDQMAEILKEPVGTVKTRLRDAIGKLKKSFDDPEKKFQSLDVDKP